MTAFLRSAGLVGILALGLTGCRRECTGRLSDIGKRCPATFDGDLATLPCASASDFELVYGCGDLVLISTGPNYGGLHCSYDATSHALVGAEVYTDIEAYCDGESFAQSAGRLPPPSCFQAGPAAKRECYTPPPECVGTLEELGKDCPAVFSLDLEATPCASSWESRTAFVCGALDVLLKQSRAGEVRCTYDANTHLLVGAELVTGSAACEGLRKVAGQRSPAGCLESAPANSKFCPGQCNKPLAEIGGSCPATFAGDLATVPCSPTFSYSRAQQCGGLFVLSTGPNLSTLVCAYDVTTTKLVGARTATDVASYCEGSYVATAGQLPPEVCPEGAPAALRTCPAP